MERILKIIFSPTGGTEKVADILCRAFGGETDTVDLSAREFAGCEIEGGLAVIAMPSFGGRAPKTAVDRLKQIKATGTKAVAVAVYGNREQEDTLLEIADAAGECGFEVIAGIEAIAEHSIAHQYAAGRPDSADEAELTALARSIPLDRPASSPPALPGNRPYRKAGSGLVPKASAACTACRLCATRCPVGAIDAALPRKTDKHLCIHCMRCVSICPVQARGVSGAAVALVGAALKKACGKRKENRLFL